jgi:hypothetical protein
MTELWAKAAHQAGVADDIDGEDGRQFALLTHHGSFPRFACVGS